MAVQLPAINQRRCSKRTHRWTKGPTEPPPKSHRVLLSSPPPPRSTWSAARLHYFKSQRISRNKFEIEIFSQHRCHTPPFVMSSGNKSAINGGTIDIAHLEREIRQDVATYRQYKAEDGMKKRAVHSSEN